MHPPPPGPVVQPNVTAIENALRNITFPISKREMLDEIGEEETIILGGRNVELRTLVRDLNDDFFDTEDEFRTALEVTYGERIASGERVEAIDLPMPPTGFPEEMPRGAPGASDQPALPDDNA